MFLSLRVSKPLCLKMFLKRAIAIGGRLTAMLLHGLCVFLCTPLYDCKMRTLIVVPPLLGKNVEKALVFHIGQPKLLKKHSFFF